MRLTLDFADFDCMEFEPVGDLYPGSPARVFFEIGEGVLVVVEVEPGRSADNARRAAAMILGAAEHVDPKGYEVTLPASDVALAAPTTLPAGIRVSPEVETVGEDFIEHARRRA